MIVDIEPYDKKYAKPVFELSKQLVDSIEADDFFRNIDCYTNHPEYQLILATTEGSNAVGFAALHYCNFIHHKHPVCRIVALVVGHEFRKLGIGRCLINEVERLALKKDCKIIELTSSSSRERDGTFNFYHKSGYSESNCKKKYLRKYI